MAYKILETVIISSAELEDKNREFINYFCKCLGCPWRGNDGVLRRFLKFHKIKDGFLVEYGHAVWGHTATQYANIFLIDEDKHDLVSNYFNQ